MLCPHCRRLVGCTCKLLDWNIGPQLVRCMGCRSVNKSHQYEWLMLSSRQRRGYWIWSTLYVIAVGGGAAAAALYWMFYQTELPPSVTIIILTLMFVIGSSIAVQAARAIASIARDSRGDISPKPASFFLPTTNTPLAASLPVVLAGIMVAVHYVIV